MRFKPENDSPVIDPYQREIVSQPNADNFETLLEEARATIVRQNDMMEHIDDRALNLVRTAAVLLGIIITGLNVASSGTPTPPTALLDEIDTLALVAGSVSVGFLVLSVLTGVVTTQYSRPIHGTGERPRVQIRNRPSRGQSLRELARQYDDQIQEMAVRIESNRKILWALQIEMVIAVTSLAAAMGFMLPTVRIPIS